MGTIWLEAESMGELILPWLTKAFFESSRFRAGVGVKLMG